MRSWFAIAVILISGVLSAPATAGTPVELGTVEWRRGFDDALAASGTSGKPVFVLFQEVPGCQTCVDFGNGPLSHPLLVEAIESEFEPVVVFNNRPGIDAEVLAACKEPAWSNPVVRFMNARGEDLLPRRGGVYDVGGIAGRMVSALEAARRPVPEYLRLAALESSGSRDVATFGMHCFWEGEARLGSIDGVISTRPGWLDGGEVVEVTFDPSALSREDLAKEAVDRGAATRVFPGEPSVRDARPADHLRSLHFSSLRWVPLTPLQATRVNAALAAGTDPLRYMSPRQQRIARDVARALDSDPKALEDLRRPDDVSALSAYSARLADRLER